MKVGDEYFAAWVDTDEGGIGIDLWVITALRDGRVHARRKTDYTWVKQSTKTGDYGWSASCTAYDRKAFSEGEMPTTWARTKAAAYSKALPEVETAIKRLTKLRAQITGQRTRARKSAAPRKQS